MERSGMNLDAFMNSIIIKNALLDSSMCQIQHEYNRVVEVCESVEQDLVEYNKTASRLEAEVTALKLRQKKSLDIVEGLKREVATLRSLDHSLSLQLQSILAENSELAKQQDALLDKCNTVWHQYQEEYGKLPWIQELRKVNLNNKQLVIELKIQKQKLFQEEQKNVLLHAVNRRREQLPIIALARVSLDLSKARSTNSTNQSKKLNLKEEVNGLKEMKKNLIEELAKKTRSMIDVIKHKRDLMQVGHQPLDKNSLNFDIGERSKEKCQFLNFTFSSRPDTSLSFLKLPGLPLSLRSLVGSLHGDQPSSASTALPAGFKDDREINKDLNQGSISQMMKALNACKFSDTSSKSNNPAIGQSEKRGQCSEDNKDKNLESTIKNYDVPQNNHNKITSNLANTEIIFEVSGESMEKDGEYWEQSDSSSQKWLLRGNIESNSCELINTSSEMNQEEKYMNISPQHTSSPVNKDSNNRNENKSPPSVDSQQVTQTRDLNRLSRGVDVNKTNRNEQYYSPEEEDDYRSPRRGSQQIGLDSSALYKDSVDLQNEFVYSERQQQSALKRVKLQTNNEYNRFSQDIYITQTNSPREPNEFSSSPLKSNREGERSPNTSPPSVFKKPSPLTSSLMKSKTTLKQIKKRVTFANWEESNLQPSQDIFSYDSGFSGSQELMDVDSGSGILKRSCRQDRTKNVENELRPSRGVADRHSPNSKQQSLSTHMDFDSQSDNRQTSPPSQQGRQMLPFVQDTRSVMSPVKMSPSPVHETFGRSKSGATSRPEPPSTPDLPQYIMSPIKTPIANQDISHDDEMTPMFNFASSSSILSPVRPTSFLNFGNSSEENEPFNLFGPSSEENDDSNIASNFFKLF